MFLVRSSIIPEIPGRRLLISLRPTTIVVIPIAAPANRDGRARAAPAICPTFVSRADALEVKLISPLPTKPIPTDKADNRGIDLSKFLTRLTRESV